MSFVKQQMLTDVEPCIICFWDRRRGLVSVLPYSGIEIDGVTPNISSFETLFQLRKTWNVFQAYIITIVKALYEGFFRAGCT